MSLRGAINNSAVEQTPTQALHAQLRRKITQSQEKELIPHCYRN